MHAHMQSDMVYGMGTPTPTPTPTPTSTSKLGFFLEEKLAGFGANRSGGPCVGRRASASSHEKEEEEERSHCRLAMESEKG